MQGGGGMVSGIYHLLLLAPMASFDVFHTHLRCPVPLPRLPAIPFITNPPLYLWEKGGQCGDALQFLMPLQDPRGRRHPPAVRFSVVRADRSGP